MRAKGSLIMGIGHRVKSINNPDMRVTLIKDFVQTNFPSTPLLVRILQSNARSPWQFRIRTKAIILNLN